MLPGIEQYALLRMTTHTVFVFSSIDSLKAMQQHERKALRSLGRATTLICVAPLEPVVQTSCSTRSLGLKLGPTSPPATRYQESQQNRTK